MDEDLNIDLSQLIDRAVKALFRECPTLITRLAGLNIAAEDIRVEDPNLNLPELRADHVFILPEGPDRPQGAIYLEYQLRPDPSLLPTWAAKWGGLSRQLGMPVLLLVLYLQKGDRATFPAQLRTQMGGFETELRFATVRLWDYSGRIRSGDLPELAPLLLLSEDNPTEETIREEAALIRNANLPPETQADLLGLVLMVASKRFSRQWLRTLFEEEINTMQDLGLIGDWIQEGEARGRAEGEARGRAEGEARGKAEGEARGKAEGEARGKAEGEARGKAEGEAEGARKAVLRFLVKRFGTLPPALLEKVEQADAEWRLNLLDRAMDAETLAELADLYANAPE